MTGKSMNINQHCKFSKNNFNDTIIDDLKETVAPIVKCKKVMITENRILSEMSKIVGGLKNVI